MNIFKSIKLNEIKSGLLIRFDDVAENMNWKFMEKCEHLLNKHQIKPVLGVIPNNQDPELLSYPKKNNFWKIVKSWQQQGWEISMHGYTHVYDVDTKKRDYFGYGGRSEFCGHSIEEQTKRLKMGLRIFNENNIKISSFFSPNHTYDLNTFEALKVSGIYEVIDGYGLAPYLKNDIKFIPQLFYKILLLPIGIQSTQIHLNNWQQKDFNNFEKFIEKNSKKIIDYQYALQNINNSLFIKQINFLIEKILKFKRIF